MQTTLPRLLAGIALLLFFIFSTTGCPAKTDAQKIYGSDSDYFIGLKLLSEGNEKEARTRFNNCIKKGSYYCAKRSAEALCSFGNIQEKNIAAENLIKKFPDEDSLLIAAKQFKSSGEINKLIECTGTLDFKTAKNELIRLRLEAMGSRGDSAFESEVYRWFTECPLSTEHYQFYRDFYVHPDFDKALENSESEFAANLVYTPQQFAMQFRIEAYKRNYSYTVLYAKKLFEYFEEKILSPQPQLVSDIGKSFLYGSTEFSKNAAKCQQLAEAYRGTPAEFYFWFYSGRLYAKAGMYYKQTKTGFENAMLAAADGSQKDNALWYLLNTSLNFSMDSIISSIGQYSRQWDDAEYFEDFFEQLVTALLASGRWNEFGTIYKAIDGYASDLTVAQFAYIYGRLIQEGLAEGSESDMIAAFERACKSGTSMYYKVLAAYRLGIRQNDFVSNAKLSEILNAPGGKTGTPDDAAGKLLTGYAYFGFPQYIYTEWQKFPSGTISDDVNFYLADFLAKCADKDNKDYYTQSLRIAARAQLYSKTALSKDEMALVYPNFYNNYVSEYCKKYELDESIMYSLIRSESFFEADVISSAGAVGLTQLMEFTAEDIAARFKMSDYSLTDPETNIRFGTWYLANLISRCDNSLLLGFFSYNAGISRVRRWLQSSLTEFGKKSNMPLDLFLETVPFAETREYGRKLISAAAAYEWTYNPQNYDAIVEELLK